MWHIASQQPKHLAAIAPWEGLSDFYRESVSGAFGAG
jgi:predicted acyl esterase